MDFKQRTDISGCDRTRIWLNNEDEPVHKTKEIVLIGLFCHLSIVSEKNIEDWLLRLFLAQHLGLFLETSITTQDLKDHIGLKIQVPHKQTRQWWNEVTSFIFDKSKEEIEQRATS